jgi:nucleoside-diphosphate-sugar epimerase
MKLLEAACVRPADAEDRARLADEDDYGDGKLKVEEVLHSQMPFAFSALRLPDVYGPFDDKRFWAYYLWLSVSDFFPIFVAPATKTRVLSLIFVEDVAQICLALASLKPRQIGSFNCSSGGCEISLEAFLSKFAACAQFPAPTFFSEPSEDKFCDEYLPSVDYCIDSAEIEKRLPKFVSTDFDAGIAKMASFYERAWNKYPQEREEVMENFPKKMAKRIRKVMGRLG